MEEKVYFMKDGDFACGFYDEDFSFYLKSNIPSEKLQEIIKVARLINDEDEEEIKDLIKKKEISKKYMVYFEEYCGCSMQEIMQEIIAGLGYHYEELKIDYNEEVIW